MSANAVGYLYRVAQSAMRPQLRWWHRVRLVECDARTADADIDIDLADALARLNRNERVAVVLVHSHGWSYAEVASLLGVSTSAVTNHVHRGLRKLRRLLEEVP
jgi:DNA-directed RNA polymerase specialized sigma24 family protein